MYHIPIKIKATFTKKTGEFSSVKFEKILVV